MITPWNCRAQRVWIFLLFALCPLSVHCQEENEDGEPAERSRVSYWKAVLPDGSFLVPHHAITSISKSSYVVDGAIRVTEMSVGTSGSVQGRFYYAELISTESPAGIGQSTINFLEEKSREIKERIGRGEVGEEVVKNYPDTTHAHTVEFLVASPEILDRMLTSLEQSYLRRRNDTFKP